MVKFNELSKKDLKGIVAFIDTIFRLYHIDNESVKAFWECVDIGNKKNEGA